MKIVIDIPQGMIDAFSHEEQWTAVLCRDMNTVLQNSTPYEERPKGKWEFVQYDANPKIGNWHCTNCRGIAFAQYNFCPTCGARMER